MVLLEVSPPDELADAGVSTGAVSPPILRVLDSTPMPNFDTLTGGGGSSEKLLKAAMPPLRPGEKYGDLPSVPHLYVTTPREDGVEDTMLLEKAV